MFEVSILQMDVVKDKHKNLLTVEEHFRTSLGSAKLVVLPEMFNCPYDLGLFEAYSEVEGGQTYEFLSRMAKTYKVAVVGGSIAEKAGDQIYNTSYIFDDQGTCVGKHRKMHMFDLDIKDGLSFKESQVISPGDTPTIVDLGWLKIGVCICFDMRFPELIRQMVVGGAQLVCIPAAFNTTTGPAHWSLTGRARAVDNQCFVALASPARSKDLTYKAYGHSMLVDPWGQVLCEGDHGPQAISHGIDLDKIKEVRQALPLIKPFL